MRYLFFIATLLIVFGCSRNDRIPKNIISPNEMRKIMWDLMRADAYVSEFIMKDSTRDKKAESAILYEQVFTIHSTTQEAFKKSMSFYESRPDLLKVITDSLRSDEKKVQNYQDYSKKPLPPDTAQIKIKPDKKTFLKKR